jgi:hypothetical protein
VTVCVRHLFLIGTFRIKISTVRLTALMDVFVLPGSTYGSWSGSYVVTVTRLWAGRLA